MARKTDHVMIKEFTKNIHSTKRTGTDFSNMENWNEKQAKAENKVACKDCRHFEFSCYEYLGKHHKPCNQFEWW